MRWLVNKNGEFTGETWDDEMCYPATEDGRGVGPGEEGFTIDLIGAELARRAAEKPDVNYTADFAGVSWAPATSAEPTESANDEPQN